MSKEHSSGHILQALVVNGLIAAGKGVAAFYTGSGAMLAETIHSASDCANQLLLLWGITRAKQPPDPSHPLGYGRSVYFWSFMVALLLFTGGGVFSIYEGLHKIAEPEPVEWPWIGLIILFFSLVLEGYSTLSNIKELNQRRGPVPFFRYLRQSKDSDLIVVFGENLAATLGLMVAIPALLFAWLENDPRWDAFGSLGIGIVLIGVALFLAIEIKSLLVGESADPEIEAVVRKILPQFDSITKLLHLITIQQGPGQVLVMMKLGFKSDCTVGEACDLINRLEDELRNVRPEVVWSFVEPDRPRG